MTQDTKPTASLAVAVEALQVQLKTNPSQEGIVADMLAAIFKRAQLAFSNMFERSMDTAATGFVPYVSDKESYLHLKPADYPRLAVQDHQSMEGFVGKYIEYSPVVAIGLNYLETDFDEALKFYRTLVGSLITNRSTRKEWQDLTDRFVASAEKRAKEDSVNKTFWSPGSHNSIVKLGSVVSRLGDLKELDEDGTIITKRLQGIDMVAIKGRVDEISSFTDMLLKDLKKNGITDLTQAQINNLASGIMELAYQAEHFSVAVYRARVYVSALNRLRDTVVAFK